MISPEQFVLMHAAAPYDPVKAHEYYMRTRKLKPRQRSSKSDSYTVNVGNSKTVKLSAQKLEEQKAYAEHRVSVIKDKLKGLNAQLKKKLAAANKNPTAAEKSKAARESRQYRDKHKQELATKAKRAASSKPATSSKSSSKTTTVATIKKNIVTTKASLKAAVAKQKQLATAKRNG